MPDIAVEVWLYGALAKHGGEHNQGSFARLDLVLREGSTMADLLGLIGMPTAERGITFISGQLSAMPGLQPDLGHILQEGDRIGMFDPRSMWPMQYRHGAAATSEMAEAMDRRGVHHSYHEE